LSDEFLMLRMRITESNYLNHFNKASTITFAGAVTEQDIARTST
jgi:hypothetical protein